MGRHTLEFDAIGTSWRIDTERPLPPSVVDQVNARVETFDATYSRFRPDSLVSSLRLRPGRMEFPDDARPLFALYRQLYEATGGAVTPLVGQALEHLGYDSAYSLHRSPGTVRVPDWDAVLTVDGRVLTTTEPVLLDMGAAGKGFLVDEVAKLLEASGLAAFVIDASGDLIHRGTEVERVGLEDPRRPGHMVGVMNLSNAALCASSTFRRQWGTGLHHVVDPATAEPVTGVVATWVSSRSCAVADGLATALFFTHPDQLWRHFAFDYVRLHADGSADYSTTLDGELLG